MPIANLKGKLVLVTGAAAGIGRETALAFAEAGANLVISDIDPLGLEDVAGRVRGLGVTCWSHVVNVADAEAMRAFAGQVTAEAGPLDVLVNNAGIGYLGPFLDSPLGSWRRVVDINLMGVVHGCYFFLPAMLAAGGRRRVVNVASLAAVAPAPNMSAYAASKFAVMGLCESLALELHASQVGVTCVCPGIINTQITKNRANVAEAIGDAQLARLQAYYDTHGAHPRVVAEAIVDAVRRGRSLLPVGPFAFMLHVKRLSRRLVHLLTVAAARKSGYSA